MSNDGVPKRRASLALKEELIARKSPVSEELVQNIYDVEEGVQFFDDRGPISDRIAKLIRVELDKDDLK